MQPTIVSFYTNNWTYPLHALRLQQECKHLGLEYYIQELQDSGSWLMNTRMKTGFIRDTLNKLKKPILWIDVDGSILKLPSDIDFSVDFAARKKREGSDRIWHVGTMFFNYTAKSLELVERWYNADIDGSDELAFEKVWNEGWDGTCQNLPLNYFYISRKNSDIPDDCVIFHRLSEDDSKKEFFIKSRQRNPVATYPRVVKRGLKKIQFTKPTTVIKSP
jgi:hypothetical protein